jgi:hypothetical protein
LFLMRNISYLIVSLHSWYVFSLLIKNLKVASLCFRGWNGLKGIIASE